MGASLDQIIEFTCRRALIPALIYQLREEISATHTLGNTRRMPFPRRKSTRASLIIQMYDDEFECEMTLAGWRYYAKKITCTAHRRLHICVLIAHIHLRDAHVHGIVGDSLRNLITNVPRTILFEFDSSC
jgi:hypothetical protein